MKIDVCISFALFKWSYKTTTRFNWKIGHFCILRFSKSISDELGDSNTLFWLDCQSSYNTVALYVVWRNLDQNWHLRGDLNIEVCLTLRHKKLISQSCRSDTWSNVSHSMFFRYPYIWRSGATSFFSNHILCLTRPVWNMRILLKN